MKFVVAPDSFKGSLSAKEAAFSIAAGIRQVLPDATVVLLPVADGGEGTLDSLLTAIGGQRIERVVCGPLGEPVNAAFGILPDGETAIVEMALAAGLLLVPRNRRNPAITTTYGVGELILAAVEAGARRLVVGIGGSATNDGGAGAMQALGVKFMDRAGRLLGIPTAGAALMDLEHIAMSGFVLRAAEIDVVVASDVTNLLVGQNGASAVYGPQKGADAATVAMLDSALANYGRVIERDLGVSVSDRPGAGAAGGLGAALIAFLGARMESGIDLVLDRIGFDKAIMDADYVITGEGRIDQSTLHGKAISGILSRCKTVNVPVTAFAGSVHKDAADRLRDMGLRDAIPIVAPGVPVEISVKDADKYLQTAVERLVKILRTA